MLRHHIDRPGKTERADPLCFAVEGWVNAGERQGGIARIEVRGDGGLLGATGALALRPDVCRAEGLPASARTGFTIFCQWRNPPPAGNEVELRASFGDGTSERIAIIGVDFIKTDYRQMPFGHVLDSNFLPIVHREHVYTSGPSLADGSAECLALLRTHLPPAPARLLDVGCGLGFYGRELRRDGYDWLGVEMKAEDCRALAAAGLPHRQVDGTGLPFEPGSFDAALCVEVLEHVEDPHAFLREIARVAPRLVISVPNFETVCYLYRYQALPWHILEADHKNFFSRWSLQHLLEQHYDEIEVGCYHRMQLATPEGTPLYYNLFASCRGAACA